MGTRFAVSVRPFPQTDTFHDLQKSYCANLADKVPLHAVQKLAGHADKRLMLLRGRRRTATPPNSSDYPQSAHDSTDTPLRVYEASPP